MSIRVFNVFDWIWIIIWIKRRNKRNQTEPVMSTEKCALWEKPPFIGFSWEPMLFMLFPNHLCIQVQKCFEWMPTSQKMCFPIANQSTTASELVKRQQWIEQGFWSLTRLGQSPGMGSYSSVTLARCSVSLSISFFVKWGRYLYSSHSVLLWTLNINTQEVLNKYYC